MFSILNFQNQSNNESVKSLHYEYFTLQSISMHAGSQNSQIHHINDPCLNIYSIFHTATGVWTGLINSSHSSEHTKNASQ